MFCKLLVLNFLNLLLNPQHFSFRKGRSVSIAQDKRKQVQPRAVLSYVFGAGRAPGSDKAVSVEAGSSNKKARIWGPSWFLAAAPRGWSNLKTGLSQEGKTQRRKASGKAVPRFRQWMNVRLLTIPVGMARNKHWMGLVSISSTWQ